MLRAALLIVLGMLAGCADSSAAPEPEQRAEPRPVVRTGTPAKMLGPLVIDPGDIVLGPIEPNSIHEVEITLRNTGDRPVSILKTSSDCKCTVPEDLEGTVIAAGESYPIRATFTARASPGTKTAKLWLYVDWGTGSKRLQTTISGDVIMAVNAEPAYVDALKGVDRGTVQVEALDGRPFRIITAGGRPPVFAGGYAAGGPPQTSYTLRWEVDYPASRESCTGDERLWWVIETDHPDCPVLPMRIRHECTGMLADPNTKDRGWMFNEYMVNLGGLEAGEPIDIDVEIRRLYDKPTAGVTAVRSLSPDATAELLETLEPPGEITTCRVRFTPREGYEGLLYAMVEFQTATGDKEVAFLARVQE